MISVVLATHNESANIDRCLAAVKDFADEIIIADGESTDDTVKKAKAFGAKIISTTNKQNFHINKQMAMDAAKGELVLQMDADEVVDKDLAQFIVETHKKLLQKESLPAAWWIKRKNFFFGRFLKKGGQYPDPVIRLYQNGKASLPQKDVHEQMTVDGEVGWAEGHLLHYSNPTFADYLRKFNTYTSFAAELEFQHGKHPSIMGWISAFIFKPISTFFSLYLRHRGYVDGLAGFLFAACSAVHHPVTYLKLYERYEQDQRRT
jgi:glycosyltransferase involved in cell wall biosynthesis